MRISDLSSDVCSSDLKSKGENKRLGKLNRHHINSIRNGLKRPGTTQRTKGAADQQSSEYLRRMCCSGRRARAQLRSGQPRRGGGGSKEVVSCRKGSSCRSEARRVGKEGGRTCKYRGGP